MVHTNNNGVKQSFSTASLKCWIKNVKNGENYSPTSTCKIKHIWKSVSLGLHNTEITLIIKIKLIRYDPNGVPIFFPWTVPPVYFWFCMTYTYLTFIDSKVLFTSQTYILSNDPVNLEFFWYKKMCIHIWDYKDYVHT